MARKNAVYVYILIYFLLSNLSGLAQYQPAQDLKGLFEDVQLSGIFDDSKTFVDAVPNLPPDSILNLYHQQNQAPGFSLDSFVYQYFTIPNPIPTYSHDQKMGIETHIDKLWFHLRRTDNQDSLSSKISLPYPYIVPGGRFREMYYWDSYFTMLGLRQSGQTEMIEHMVNNFAWYIDSLGFIPNGNRTYYLSRSQPPFFALMVSLLAEIKGNHILVKFRDAVEKEYQFWMEGAAQLSPGQSHKRVVKLNDSVVLNRYWDNLETPRPESYREDYALFRHDTTLTPAFYRNIRAAAESGWDFSARWLADNHTLTTIQTTQIIPVDLNALLYFYEELMSVMAMLDDDDAKATFYKLKADTRKKAINTYCWNEKSGFYTDYHFTAKRTTNNFTLAGMYPLFFNIASLNQAAKAKDKIGHFFLYEGGVVTSLTLSKQQWDAPNGWAPLQYITALGLENYSYAPLAEKIANLWMLSVEQTYNSSGKIMEKYNVLSPNIPGGGGEYPTQDGFGWTNGVYLFFQHYYRESQ